MQVSRGIETAIEEGIEKIVIDRYRYRGGVEEQSIKCKNRSSIYPPTVEKLSRRQELSWSIHQVSRSCRECDKKKLKKLDRQQGIKKVLKRCRASFYNQFFEMWKTQTWMQSNMQLNQWSNQHIKLSKSYLNKNFKHMDLKNTHTHTHTLNKFNQFLYFKKQVKTV